MMHLTIGNAPADPFSGRNFRRIRYDSLLRSAREADANDRSLRVASRCYARSLKHLAEKSNPATASQLGDTTFRAASSGES